MGGAVRLDIKKRPFARRVVGHSNRLPGEEGTALTLPEFKKHAQHSQAHGMILGDNPVQGQELGSMIMWVLSNLAYFLIL